MIDDELSELISRVRKMHPLKVTSTKGIFSFDEQTYVWSWFIVGGDGKVPKAVRERDVRARLLAIEAPEEVYETDDPFDKRDVKHVYHAFWKPDHDANAVEYGNPLDELVVNGNVELAAEILLKHQAVHIQTTAPGGDA